MTESPRVVPYEIVENTSTAHRAIACKYCVGLTHFDCENHVLFPTAYDYDFGT